MLKSIPILIVIGIIVISINHTRFLFLLLFRRCLHRRQPCWGHPLIVTFECFWRLAPANRVRPPEIIIFSSTISIIIIIISAISITVIILVSCIPIIIVTSLSGVSIIIIFVIMFLTNWWKAFIFPSPDFLLFPSGNKNEKNARVKDILIFRLIINT